MMSPRLLCLFFLAMLVFATIIDQTNGQGIFPNTTPDPCPSGSSCITLGTCPSLLQLLRNPTINNLRQLQRSLCGFDRSESKVCCPNAGGTDSTTPTTMPNTTPTTSPITTLTTSPTTTPTTTSTTRPTAGPTTSPTTQTPGSGNGAQLPANCGHPAPIQTRIFFGQDAPLGRYPWMALLGFSSNGNVIWGCGGSLITSRYVVTAGHCTSPQFTFNRRLSNIRLGEHNLGTDDDCVTTGATRVCAPAHQDFTPEQIIRHPDFNTRGTVSDDISLIRLNRPATFNGYVQPICLPPPSSSVSTLVGSRQVEVAGWGSTQNGPNTQTLQTVRLPFVTKASCNPHYNNGLIDEQVCFGGEGQRDSCFGDSGGPVMIPGFSNPRYTFLALVSFGQPQCGVVGIPAVYTDITFYRAWIISQLRA